MLLTSFLCSSLVLSDLCNNTGCWAPSVVSVSAPYLLLHSQHLFQEEAVVISSRRIELCEGCDTPSAYCKSYFRIVCVGVGFNLIWHTLTQTVSLGFYLRSVKYWVGFSILLYVKRLTTFWVCSKLTAVFSDNEELNSFPDFQKQQILSMGSNSEWPEMQDRFPSGEKIYLSEFSQEKGCLFTHGNLPVFAKLNNRALKFFPIH